MRKLTFLFAVLLTSYGVKAQQPDLLSLVGEEKPKKEFQKNAFKSTRVIHGQSIEFLANGTLDFRILHRFGYLNTGVKNLFGLDQANMRMGLDYGISKRIMVGFGRSNINKEMDAFIKMRPIWQATGGWPVSVVIVSGMTYTSVPWTDPSRKNFYTSRMGFYNQIIIGRKFSNGFSMQVAPIMVHRNLVDSVANPHDTYAVEIGARIKLSQRISFMIDAHPIVSGRPTGAKDSYGVGFDIETGGHVFQLHFSNATGMNEKAYITGTTADFLKSEIRFGFNLSRVFTIVKPKMYRK
ncbi:MULTISPECIES: DUF5777 family beta-barrel protein [unclassified Paraflavitalea]|uniref:DUF5777 family beta-barrel protein n=1 Tax=unclassified Paraflavitalea TaxID=2798305 RepID=UPI003D337F90